MLLQFIKIGYWKCWEKAAEQSCCAEVLAREEGERGMFDNGNCKKRNVAAY